MLAVGVDEPDILNYLDRVKIGKLSVPCVNSPQNTTMSGDEQAIDELKLLLDAEAIFARKLRVDTAYHSHHMETIADEYLASTGSVKTSSP